MHFRNLTSSVVPVSFLSFSAADYIQISDSSFSGVLILCLGWCSRIFSTSSRKVQPRAIRVINSPNLTISLQYLSFIVVWLQIFTFFYRFFHGHCSLEIKNIMSDLFRHVRHTRSSTQSHPFQVMLYNPRILSHKSSFIPRTSQLWNTLPSTSFPESYTLSYFNSNINKLDPISLCTYLSFPFLS